MKRKIVKGLTIGFWLMLTIGVCTLLVAAIRKRNERVCQSVQVAVTGPADGLFLDKKDILQLMISVGGQLVGQPMEAIDLNRMEDTLRKLPWISEAELYFTNQGVLDVHVVEREPVARVFTRAGTSFYIDSSLIRLPLNHNYLTRKPVFTGFPSDQKILRPVDSQLLRQVSEIGRFILKDSFWMAQVDQVDIDEDRQFRLVPKVGNQVVHFGDGRNAPSKFAKLMIFYREILAKTGWNRYSAIHIGYKGQIVATRRDAQAAYSDTTSARKNMEEMFRQQQSEAMKDTSNDIISTRLNEQL